ncbi:MAG: rhomboid family intramembrane serine protease [Pseudomonadota bacterium]
MNARPPGSANAPFFNAPAIVVYLTLAIVVAHAVRLLLPQQPEDWLFYQFALIPARLSLMVDGGGNTAAYGPLSLLWASVGHVFLHVDWMHVIMNTVMLLAVGAGVTRRFGAARFLTIFFASAIGGAALFFLVRAPESAPAIGASGGVSGIMAGAFLIMSDPRATWPVLLSKSFLQTSAAFLIINIIMAFAGPAMFGSGIAWDAHIGGYVVGAVLTASIAARQ